MIIAIIDRRLTVGNVDRIVEALEAAGGYSPDDVGEVLTGWRGRLTIARQTINVFDRGRLERYVDSGRVDVLTDHAWSWNDVRQWERSPYNTFVLVRLEDGHIAIIDGWLGVPTVGLKLSGG